MDDSLISWYEIIEETVPTSFNEKIATCKTLHFIYIFVNYYSIINSC